jgi:hypothetical protein
MKAKPKIGRSLGELLVEFITPEFLPGLVPRYRLLEKVELFGPPPDVIEVRLRFQRIKSEDDEF